MKPVTLAGVHIKMLENAETDTKNEFIEGIISISKGKEPQASCFWKDVFYLLVNGCQSALKNDPLSASKIDPPRLIK